MTSIHLFSSYYLWTERDGQTHMENPYGVFL